MSTITPVSISQCAPPCPCFPRFIIPTRVKCRSSYSSFFSRFDAVAVFFVRIACILFVSHPGDWVASNRIVYVQQFAVCFGLFHRHYYPRPCCQAELNKVTLSTHTEITTNKRVLVV